MRFHTHLSEHHLHTALQRAKDKGRVAEDVEFMVLEEKTSRTHPRAFEVQLGVRKNHPYRPLPENHVNQYGRRQKTRRTANGVGGWYAATWHEWGWFIAELFELDPQSRWGSNRSGYFSQDDFDAKTKWQFDLDDE